MPRTRHALLATLLILAGCRTHGASQNPPAAKADSTPQGTFLPNQWTLQPAGESIPMGDFPISLVASPDGRYAAALHSGHGKHEVRIIDVATHAVVHTEQLKNIWLGGAFTPDGKRFLVSCGDDDAVMVYNFRDGILTGGKRVVFFERKKDDKGKAIGAAWYAGGIAVAPDGRTAYIAMQYANKIVRLDLDTLTPDPKPFAKFTNPHAYPYKLVMTKDGKTIYASLWGGSAVARIDVKTGAHTRIATKPHPNDLLLDRAEKRLFVACANTNGVDVIDTKTGLVQETLSSSLFPDSPEGSTPNGLALSPDEKTLLVANADNNDLAVFDVKERGHGRPLGFIPTGWYPTAVAFTMRGAEILVLNGKGDSSHSNPGGPQPGVTRPKGVKAEYIGGLMLGTASFIATPTEEQLAVYTKQTYATTPLREDLLPVHAEANNPIPARVGDPSPIKYCIYIIKENRTYDQVLGDVPQGNGDASLCLFPKEVTPNQHAIVNDFVLFDNFYVESEVSCDGHMWTTAAYATDFTEKSWPADYGGHASYGYKSEGQDPVADPVAGYLWDKAKEAGVSYMSFGEWVQDAGPEGKGHANSKSLIGHFSPYYSGFNLNVSDLDRAKVYMGELKKYEAAGEMPRLTILRLPNDHTAGGAVGKRTPQAFVAENDYALGTILEALSNTPFWKETAVFVVEDDAQNGPDHVDAHRTTAYVFSPYAKRNFVDHTMYSTASMLRTMELILGMKPMSQFDASARPMYQSFTMTPDFSPWKKHEPLIDLTAKNQKENPTAKASASLQLDKEDANDDIAFNQIIWKTVRPGTEMPAPVRASFIHPLEEKDDDD
ncbi:alkaline phosphatase family protein [soil metagenome]